MLGLDEGVEVALVVFRHTTKYRSHIRYVQIAGVPERAEPDDGEIAFPAIFAALDKLKYGGWVGCEYRPRGDTDQGLAWMDRLGMR